MSADNTELVEDRMYDSSLPSKKPFMWVEDERVLELGEDAGRVRLLSYGAYNAMGLIGTEKGGVAAVLEPAHTVIATKDVPNSMLERQLEITALNLLLDEMFDASEEVGVGKMRLVRSALICRRYYLRIGGESNDVEPTQ